MILTKNIKDYCAERKTAIKDIIKRDFSDFVKKPTLAVFQVGNVEASTRYIRNKKKIAKKSELNLSGIIFQKRLPPKNSFKKLKI